MFDSNLITKEDILRQASRFFDCSVDRLKLVYRIIHSTDFDSFECKMPYLFYCTDLIMPVTYTSTFGMLGAFQLSLILANEDYSLAVRDINYQYVSGLLPNQQFTVETKFEINRFFNYFVVLDSLPFHAAGFEVVQF